MSMSWLQGMLGEHVFGFCFMEVRTFPKYRRGSRWPKAWQMSTTEFNSVSEKAGEGPNQREEMKRRKWIWEIVRRQNRRKLITDWVWSMNKREEASYWSNIYDFKQKMTSYWVSGWWRSQLPISNMFFLGINFPEKSTETSSSVFQRDQPLLLGLSTSQLKFYGPCKLGLSETS